MQSWLQNGRWRCGDIIEILFGDPERKWSGFQLFAGFRTNWGLRLTMQNLDLLDETRQLVHTGRVLRQPEGGFELGGWTELFILLFDNYRQSNSLSRSF